LESNWRLNVHLNGLSAPGPVFGFDHLAVKFVGKLITPLPQPEGVMTHLVGFYANNGTMQYLALASVPGNTLDVLGFGGSIGHWPNPLVPIFPD